MGRTDGQTDGSGYSKMPPQGGGLTNMWHQLLICFVSYFANSALKDNRLCSPSRFNIAQFCKKNFFFRSLHFLACKLLSKAA